MPSDRPWSDTDRELVAETIDGALPDDSPHTIVTAGRVAAAVLDALTAAGWRRETDVRTEVSTEIAAAVRQQLTEGDDHAR